MHAHSAIQARSEPGSPDGESGPCPSWLADVLISILFEVLGPTGHGPSSSHTMAPHRVAYLAFKKLGGRPDSAEVTFFNSFAGTADGHRTDIALAAGFSGMNPDEQNPQFRDARRIAESDGMAISITKLEDPAEHPNTIVLRLIRGCDTLVVRFISTGGGRFKILTSDLNGVASPLDDPVRITLFDPADEQLREAMLVLQLTLRESPLTFHGVSQRARDLGLDLPEFAPLLETFITANQGILHKRTDVLERARFVLGVMLNAVENGVDFPQTTAVTPGNWATTLEHHRSDLGPLETAFIGGIGAQEYNAGMGYVAAAPTCGASGTLPGVLSYFKKERGATEDELLKALWVAGLIGLVAFSRGPVSGSQAGCGAEIGIAAMMSAGAAAYLMKGDAQQIDAAAAFVGQNYQALECSPKNGFVEYPCVPRNGFAAVAAILSASMAVNGLAGPYSLDDVITRIFVLGRQLPATLRESESGDNMETFLDNNCCNSGCAGCPNAD